MVVGDVVAAHRLSVGGFFLVKEAIERHVEARAEVVGFECCAFATGLRGSVHSVLDSSMFLFPNLLGRMLALGDAFCNVRQICLFSIFDSLKYTSARLSCQVVFIFLKPGGLQERNRLVPSHRRPYTLDDFSSASSGRCSVFCLAGLKEEDDETHDFR